MKKPIIALLLILAVLSGLLCAAADTAYLPAQVQKKLNEDNASGYTVTGYVERAGGSPYYAFALIRNAKGKNVLYVFRANDSGWKYQFKTSAAVPQGSGRTVLRLDDPQTLFIALDSDSGEYWVKYAIYTYSSSNWYLNHYYDRSRKVNVLVSGKELTYYGGADYNQLQGSARGTVENNLRYISLTSIPATLKEAKNKLTSAPSIPTGTLSAEKVKFTGGKNYAVYSGPGESYLRGANGKASVSTNDWIQVFGRENGWIMIQYAISADHMRIGWIPEKSLPKNAAIGNSTFTPTAAFTASAATLTDDPLFSGSALLQLPANAAVTWLASMGEWAYVEYADAGIRARGFIPLDRLSGFGENEAVALAKAYIIAASPETDRGPVTALMLRNYGVYAAYDELTAQWAVMFDSPDGEQWVVCVDPVNGEAWFPDGSNG